MIFLIKEKINYRRTASSKKKKKIKKKKKTMATQGGKRLIDYIWMGGATTLGLGSLYLLVNLGYGIHIEYPNIQEKRALSKQIKEELAAQRAHKMLQDEFDESLDSSEVEDSSKN